MHLVEAGGHEALVPPLVERQAGVDDAGPTVERRDDLFGACHLGDAARADEADGLDPGQAGGGEPGDELGADGRLEDGGVILQPVARGHVTECHRRAHRTPSCAELRDLVVGEAEQVAVHLAVVASLFPRGRPAHCPRGARQLRHDPGSDVGAELRVDVLDQHVACTELRILEDVGDGVDRTADHAGVVEDAVDLGGIVQQRPVGDDALDLLLVVAARDVRCEPLVVGELRSVDRVAEPAEDVVGIGRDHHPLAVARLEDVRRRDPLQVRPLRPAHDAEPVVLGHRALEQREGRLHQGDVHDLAEPAPEGVTPVERGEDTLGREHAGERVPEGYVHARRRLSGEAVDVADAAHGLGHRSEAGAACVRTGLPVAGDARQHDARVDLGEPVVAEVPLLERARPEVLRHHVGVLDEAEQQLLAAGNAQVERDALLVAGLDGPPQRTALVARLAPVADRVGLSGRLDLDDLGAQIAEQASGERPGQQRSELDHADPGERPDTWALLHRRLLEVVGRRCHAAASPALGDSASMCWTSTSRAP